MFVNDKLGKFPGALSMSDVNLMGSAKTPQPSIYVSFRSFAGECANKLQCTVGVHDTALATGQGSHGSLSRAETRNFMAAVGPGFQEGLCRSRAGFQCRHRADLGQAGGHRLAGQGQAARAG